MPAAGHGDNHSVRPGQCRVGLGVDSDAAGPVDDYRTHAGLLTFFVAERIETHEVRVPAWHRSRAFERGERRAGNSETRHSVIRSTRLPAGPQRIKVHRPGAD